MGNGETLAYDVGAAAKAIGIGKTLLFEEIKAGRLQAKKLGRRTLILARDLRAYAENLPERQPVGATKKRPARRSNTRA